MNNSSWLKKELVSATSNHNILTWQQFRGKECKETMLPSAGAYLESRLNFKRENEAKGTRSNYNYYSMHECKMLYLLTQHLLWNRKNYPFLLCKCKCGQGIRDPNHVCRMRSHEDDIALWDKSKQRWDRKHKKLKEGEVYSCKHHLDWVDIYNEGVSHFGIHPTLFPRTEIRFDTFHLKCSITRRLMGTLRKVVLEQSSSFQDQFSLSVLGKFWNSFHLFVWNTGKPFSSFNGNELTLFVVNTAVITEFLREKLVLNSQVSYICTGMELWFKCFKFLGISRIEEEKLDYMTDISNFEENTKAFYEAGRVGFLFTNGIEGEVRHATCIY